MEPRILKLGETRLVGEKIRMSFQNDRTAELWRSFSPRRKEVKDTVDTDLYSVEIYNDSLFFENFNPLKEFEKWAAIKVNNIDSIPVNMHKLIIPEGFYAVFSYRGKPSEARGIFQYIYGTWLPNSKFNLDDRPHFALMGEKYRGEDATSEEEFWIPVIEKNEQCQLQE